MLHRSPFCFYYFLLYCVIGQALYSHENLHEIMHFHSNTTYPAFSYVNS